MYVYLDELRVIGTLVRMGQYNYSLISHLMGENKTFLFLSPIIKTGYALIGVTCRWAWHASNRKLTLKYTN